MLIKEYNSKSPNKNNHIYLNNSKKTKYKNKKNNKFNSFHTNKDPSFQINKTLKKYIYEKLESYNLSQVQNNKENIYQNLNKKKSIYTKDNSEEIIKYKNNIKTIKIKLKHHEDQSDLYQNGIISPMNRNNIYCKKHSNILTYLKNNEVKNGNKIFNNKLHLSNNDFMSSSIDDYLSSNIYNTINNNYMNYNNDLFPQNSMRHNNLNNTLFSKTINYHDMRIPRYNRKFFSFRKRLHISPNISEEKNGPTQKLSHRAPYRKVGNIFSRKECQFTKSKSKYNNNNITKNKLVKKSKSEKYYKIYGINRKEKCDNDYNIKVNLNIDELKKLEGENRYLKELIKLSEDKLIVRDNQLEKIIMPQNQIEDKRFPAPKQQIKKIDSSINELIQNKEHLFSADNSVLGENQSTFKGQIQDYLEEPLEEIAPKPYLMQSIYKFYN